MTGRGKLWQDNSAQAGQGDGRHAEDRNAIQADNMQEPDVPSEPSEEPERKKSVRSDVTSITKAPNREEKRGDEDPMECVEVLADDTNPAGDMLPPHRRTRMRRRRSGTKRRKREDGNLWEVGKWIEMALNRTKRGPRPRQPVLKEERK